jgi:hypothetical protein
MSTADMEPRQTGKGAIRQVVIFDGACAWYRATTRWLMKHLRAADVRFLPSHPELGQRVLARYELPAEPVPIYVFESGRAWERLERFGQLDDSPAWLLQDSGISAGSKYDTVV